MFLRHLEWQGRDETGYILAPLPQSRVSQKVLGRDGAKGGGGYREEVVVGDSAMGSPVPRAVPEGVRRAKLCPEALEFLDP